MRQQPNLDQQKERSFVEEQDREKAMCTRQHHQQWTSLFEEATNKNKATTFLSNTKVNIQTYILFVRYQEWVQGFPLKGSPTPLRGADAQ